jgi:hypothetical protein
MNRGLSLGHLKAVAALLCLAVLVSNFVSVSRWSEARGVYVDICYFRQAHLFQRFGINGLDTDISKDDDHYLQGKLKEIGHPEWSSPNRAPCHTMPDTKFVLQYPPGTGFLLGLFPEGHQVAPLYAISNLIVCCFALLGILYVRSPVWILSTAMFGVFALYVVVNPGKASYSIAPTMAVCAIVGYLTSFWLLKANCSHLLVILIGLLLGCPSI